jgi:acetoin utilization protein AcuC
MSNPNTPSTSEMVYVYTPEFANWNLGPTHPTKGIRYVHATTRIGELADSFGVVVRTIAPRPATREELALVHSEAYLATVLDGGDCPESNWSEPRPDLSVLAQLMAGGTLTALEALARGEALTAVNLPGAKHHAQRGSSSGFCVFADLAVAAELVTKGRVGTWSRVAIFDFDVHHGDGTEALLRENPKVLTYSVHRFGAGFYPGTGGSSDAAQHAYNFPMKSGDGNAELLAASEEFCALAKAFGAEIIFIAGGADGHISDPLGGSDGGGIRFTVDGYRLAMAELREQFPTTPILFGGAGGYVPTVNDHPQAEGPYGSTAEVWATATLTLAAGTKSMEVSA